MNKSQSTELFLTQEELQRINYYARQNQRPSHKTKNSLNAEEYTFKPQINKKSANLERTVDDLLRWNDRKSQKVQQRFDEEVLFQNIKCNELYQCANRLTHELDSNQPSVFERLYVVRKSNETVVQQSTKRNTSDSQPYFTKNMTNTLFSEYKKHQLNTPQRIESEAPEEQQEENYSPCLPNRIFFEQQEGVADIEQENLKITTPQHFYLDFTQQIMPKYSQTNDEPDPAQLKEPLQKKDIDVMVERLNNWLHRRNQKVLDQQEKIIQNESGQCTFQPKLNKTPRISQNYQSSVQSQQSSGHQSYSHLFQNRAQKYQ